MALVVADRVQETTTTSGTGTFNLAGAVAGFTTFVSSIGTTNTTYYVAYDQTAQVWEVGIGTVTSGSPNTLSRDTILSNSSGTTAKISFAGNTTYVWCDYPASKGLYLDASNQLNLTNASGYNIYASGAAANYFAGKVGVGVTGSSSGIANALAITGGVNAQGYRLESTINSDVTNQARGYVTFLSSQASAFTLTSLYHFQANQSTIGAGSTVTNQIGFLAESTLTGATNNYGFYSNIASGTGRYNFYAAGSANSYLNGITVHGVSQTVISSSSGIQGALQVNNTTGVTALNIGCYVNANSGNAIYASKSRSGTVGVATAGAVASGDSLFGLYMDASDGTNQIRGASLAFSVNGTVGTNIIPTQMTIQTMTTGGGLYTALTIDNAQNIYGTSGTTGMGNGFFYIPSAAGAPSGTPTSVSGRVPMYYDSTNNKFYIYNGAWKSVTLA